MATRYRERLIAVPEQPELLHWWLSFSAAASGVLGVASTLPLSDSVKPVLVLPMLLGAGAGLGALLRLPRHLLFALVPSVGLAVPIALSAGFAWVGLFSPTLVTILVAILCCALGAAGVRTVSIRTALAASGRGTADIAKRIALQLDRTLITIAATSLTAWACALVRLRRDETGPFGLLATGGGAALVVALLGATALALVGIRRRQPPVIAVAVAAVILFGRVTATLVTEAPIYSWTYKHIGLVDYIERFHALPAGTVDIYRSWPGFFTAGAWLSGSADIDPITVAHWFAPVVHVMLASAVYAMARALRQEPLVAATAALIAEVVNWVGQDYYSPQAVGLILAVAILALAANSDRHPLAGYVSLPLFAVVVFTHQLTPVWLIIATGLLTLLGRIRPWWMTGAYVALFLVYLLPRLSIIAKYGVFTGSNPVDNARTNIGSGGSVARTFTESVDRGLTLTLWTFAMVGFVILWRGGTLAAPHLIIAFSSVVLLGGQSYGGEAIFRVFLYSIAGCSVLVAPIVVPAVAETTCRGLARVRSAVAGLALCLAVLAGFQGYYGGWSYITIDRFQIDESRRLLAESDPSAIITPIAPAGWAERSSADYVRLASVNPGFDKPLVFLKDSLSQGFPTERDIQTLDRVARLTGAQFYLVLPVQVSRYNDYFGLFKNGAIGRLSVLLTAEPDWRRVVDTPRLVIFQYDPPGRVGR